MAENTAFTNRLIKEKSPYLLQHAHNPVDWFSWGDEAFQKAKKENRPLFVSVGYSTCHWCHVMEEESFSDAEIAKIMNEYFVAVKVDREEHPELDSLYMKAVMSLTGSGGWPLNVFLTPEKIPFYGGTYFPPRDTWAMQGFKTILLSVAHSWHERRDDIVRSAQALAKAMQQSAFAFANPQKPVAINETLFAKAYESFYGQFDARFGGFGDAPKFPQGHALGFLLRHGERTRNRQALDMVEQTLLHMARGGIYDQIGGGFHRYATDAQWRIPHFEKMLYDQALLAMAYLEAFQATHNNGYAALARGILDYLVREMMHPDGGFYSAQDADSPDPYNRNEKKEGAFYLWKKDEITGLLGKENSEIFAYCFGVAASGNAISDPHGEFEKKNVLYIAHSAQDAASHFKKPVAEIERIIKASKEKVFDARSRRPRPHLDDKILTDWNGLAISSFAFASRVLNDAAYRHAAEKAAQFILQQLHDEHGRLLHRYRQGEAAFVGTLDDYAFFIHGLIDLYEATFDAHYLAAARRLSRQMLALFWDEANGGFFLTAHDAEALFMRAKELYDGAIPSGNSIAALGLIRLARLTMEKECEEKAQRLFAAFSNAVAAMPHAYPQLLIALDYAFGPSREIVLAEGKNRGLIDECVQSMYRRFIPRKVVAFRPHAEKEARGVAALIPFIERMIPLEDKTTVYFCENYTCQAPVTEREALERLLDAR